MFAGCIKHLIKHRVKEVKQAAGKFDPYVIWHNPSSIFFDHE